MKKGKEKELYQAAAGRDTLLLKYFREITAHPLLTDDEEQKVARRIVDLTTEEWRACLGYLPAAAQAIPLLRMSFRELGPGMRFISRTHRSFRNRRGKLTVAQRQRYRNAIETLAPRLKSADQDRKVLDVVEKWLLAGGRNGHNGSFRGLPRLRPTSGLEQAQVELGKVSQRSLSERNRFISSNLRLVISIAKRCNRGTLSLADLIQEGNLGLMKAVQRYDPEMGYRFSTYASWWIRHAISRALADKSRTVRLPVHLVEAHKRLERVRSQFRSRGGREPTETELASEMGISLKRLRKLMQHCLDPSFSLDRQISETNPYQYIDFVTDEESLSPLEEVSFRNWLLEIQDVLQQLPAIEAKIVRWRYGVCNEPEMTLKQIGDRFDLSRERIRQLQQQAVMHMRDNLKGLY